MPRTLLDKVWEAHTVAELPSGQTQLFIGLHLVHEVTSPQAFQMLRELNLPVLFPERKPPHVYAELAGKSAVPRMPLASSTEVVR